MAAKKEEKTAIDKLFEEMKDIAVEHQQLFYELLPDCTIYESSDDPEKDQHKYLKQNIGYALFGPPTENEKEGKNNATENRKENLTYKIYKNISKYINRKDALQPIQYSVVVYNEKNKVCFARTKNQTNAEADIADTVDYNPIAKKNIDKIYEKILSCINMKDDPLQSIYCGVIYNIIICNNTNVKSEKKEKTKEETKKETKTKIKEEIRKETEAEAKEEKISVIPIPIFTIRKSIQKIVKDSEKLSTSTNNKKNYETWYIDKNARVYKSWSDYTKSNHLPKCTMVLPKDGFYQPNKHYPIEEDYSTVWIEIMDSPACALKAKVYENIDNVSKIVGIGALGLSVAGLFTPLAPVAIGISAASAATASGAWSMFRSSQELIDRYNHEESINPLEDRESIVCWLSLTGSVASIGVAGGSAYLARAAASGTTVPNAVKIAFNTVQGSNIFLNGANAYMSYNAYEKGWEKFGWLEAINLAANIMFFASSVIHVIFANDIIKDSQGRIIDEYKKTQRSKNLRRKFNRAARKAAENNTCKISENAEIIQFIRNRQDFSSFNQLNQLNQSGDGNQTFDKISHNITWSFVQGKIMIGSITLFDPIEYVIHLMSSDIFSKPNASNPSDSQDTSNNVMFIQLKQFLHDLLTELCPDNKLTLSDFDKLLEDLSSMKISKNDLRMLFDIVLILMKYDKDKEDCFFICFTFIWQFCKGNLERWGIKTRRRMESESGSHIVRKIIIVVSEAMIFDNLASAAFMYARFNLQNIYKS